MLTLIERDAARNVILGETPVNSALQKFCQYQAQLMSKQCSSAMRSVPRQLEHASDYAAKEQVYRELLDHLTAFVERSSGANPE